MALSQRLGCSGISVHQFSHPWSLLHCTTQPLLRAGSPNSCHKWVQQTSADYCSGQRIRQSQAGCTWDTCKDSCMQERDLQLRIQRRKCTSTILCLPAPSTLRTSMVHLMGCLQHCTALLAAVNPQTPSDPQFSPIGINLQANILIWTDLSKELHPETMQDEQLQVSWLFILFCIQEFSAGIDNLNQCFFNKTEHEESKNKTTEILC